MIGMQNLVPRWLGRGEYDMHEDEMHIPPIARLEPEFSPQDAEAMAVQNAASIYAKLKHKIESSQVELAEAAMREQSDKQKIAFQEKEIADQALEIAELRNTITTLESQRDADLQFMSVVRRYLDARDIKAAPKKPRNGKNGENNGEKKTATATKAAEETALQMDQQAATAKA